jgi:hypothetical protein
MPDPHDPAEAPGLKHEPPGVNPRPILWTAGLMLAGAVVLHFAVVGVQTHLQGRERGRALAGVNPLGAGRDAEPTDERIGGIPGPRLEGLQRLQDRAPPYRSTLPTPAGNPPQFHPENLHPSAWPQLQGYAWVDQEHGVARIPIDRAMAALLAMNRLPVQPGREGDRPPNAGAARMRASGSGRPAEGGRP